MTDLQLSGIPKKKTIGLVMLKPDGNKRSIVDYLRKRLLKEGCKTLLIIRDFTFSPEEALDFYPKDEAWRVKYGTKLLSFWKSHTMAIPAECGGENEQGFLVRIGDLILTRMAEYLSKSPCACVIFETDGDPGVIAKKIVGESPIPSECPEGSLRRRFNPKETLNGSYLKSRALWNVAHSSEDGLVLLGECVIIRGALEREGRQGIHRSRSLAQLLSSRGVLARPRE